MQVPDPVSLMLETELHSISCNSHLPNTEKRFVKKVGFAFNVYLYMFVSVLSFNNKDVLICFLRNLFLHVCLQIK